MKTANSLEGMISYLTKKHGGNVHEKGIVTITSKSVWKDNSQFAPKNVADLASREYFSSKPGEGQWICWDFCEMRARPTHYTMGKDLPGSWIAEGSLDGKIWTELDRKIRTQDETKNLASFAVATPVECRFIRITHTGTADGGDTMLLLTAVEFFGTLFE
jgi:hypothetical protein